MHQSHTTSLHRAVAAFSERVVQLGDSDKETADIEQELMGVLMQVGRAAMKHHFERLTPTETFVEDGKTWRKALESNLNVMTTFGTVSVNRPLFRSRRNGPTRCLVTERVGLVASFWTQHAAKLASLAIAEMPLARAESFFAEASIVPASRSSLLRLCGCLHDLWEEDRGSHEQAMRESTPIPKQAAAVAVSLDGVMVHMVGTNTAAVKAAARAEGKPDKGPAGWREASIGVIAFYDAKGERLATRRYGRMPETKKRTTKQWLDAELHHIRAARPDLTDLVIADGAQDNWSFLETLQADYEVVDFYHMAEHLHRHVSKAIVAASVETQATLSAMRHRLLEVPAAAKKVFEDLKRLQEDAGTYSRTKRPTYFERHHHRMEYANLLAANLPIGSGVTESTCKLTICDRLRRTGMLWSQRGGQGVINLRAHLVSETFDTAWGFLMKANQQRLAA